MEWKLEFLPNISMSLGARNLLLNTWTCGELQFEDDLKDVVLFLGSFQQSLYMRRLFVSISLKLILKSGVGHILVLKSESLF